MAEYIERDAAIEVALSCTDAFEPIAVDTTVKNVVWKLRKIPSADVQPVKHGRWETEEVNVGSHTGGIATINIFRCSCCDEENNYEWDYCPNCGAHMRGE